MIIISKYYNKLFMIFGGKNVNVMGVMDVIFAVLLFPTPRAVSLSKRS